MTGAAFSLIDSHAHLTHTGVFEHVEDVLDRAKQAHVQSIVNICTDLVTLERGLALSKRYPWIYQAASTTPHDVEKEGESVFDAIAAYARSGQLKAIGETGLDYYYEHSSRPIQQDFLRRYLRLALECRLPVVIHCREAFADFFEILDAEYQMNQRHAPGVLHCFTGTIAEAEEVLKRGWMLSLSGIVTFKKSIELQQIAKEVPLSQLLIETDTPYLAPQKYRGKPNEPAFLIETAAFIASLKGLSIEEVAQATTQNARLLFQLP
ncbi:TatD family hydrolase [Candidatus Protochlamydia phocaeensis]|uniref:TatD family hydrolase n=1 Tax=Candidatus Protochlamydia phocaeensis TaxID=1414722 RepID=UPI000B03395B|nr:TatD family hydrolase [Candidatus Protochlamydia phocaeensis]